MEELIQLLQAIEPMPPKLEKWLRKIIKPIHYKKGDTILSPGETCQKIFFVKKGLIRIYHLTKGSQTTDWFIREGQICISVKSFFKQVESTEYQEALEDCECWGISFEELEETYRKYPLFNVHGRKLSNEYYIELNDRASYLKRRTPKAKYEWLIKSNPDYVKRISPEAMATYLDVGLRTFYSIKRQFRIKNEGEDED